MIIGLGSSKITECQSIKFNHQLAFIAELAHVSRAAPEARSGFCFVGGCSYVLFGLVSEPGLGGRRGEEGFPPSGSEGSP